MRKFQHLTYANDFPGDNVRPFQQFQNTFDYDRWTTETTLKPCTVRWTLETNDRVKWTDDTARNTYFDRLKGDTYTLTSAMNRIVTGENVKLPVPWQALQYANYLEVQIPDEPGEGTPLDYSTPHVQRVYYFIVDCRYIAPNVTECVLIRDNWTTYINHVEIPRIEMERGHQAMKGATVEEYLTDPINHLQGLTEKEPDAPDSPVKVTKSEYHPLGAGDMWLMMAIRCAFEQLENLPTAGASGASTPATYANDSAEWGQDYVVNGYQWGGVPDVSQISTPLATLTTGGGTHPTGMTTIAIPTTASTAFIKTLNTAYPQMWNLIAAAWVVPRNLFDTWPGQIKLGSVNVWHVKPAFQKSLTSITLKKDDFSYEPRYANLTKLYTTPYSWLEITSGDTATTATLKIEETTKKRAIDLRVNLAYPYLKAETFLTGIGGNQTVSYEWRDFNGGLQATTIDASAWRDLTAHEIPTYRLFVDSSQTWNLDNSNTARVLARENAIRGYHTAERLTNVSQLNTNDSANTALSNTTASANTALSNTTTSASTTLSNTTASANTALDNTTASANTAVTNTTATNVTVSDNALAYRTTKSFNNDTLNRNFVWKDVYKQLDFLEYSRQQNTTKIENDRAADYLYATQSYDAEAETAVASAIGTTVATVGLAALTISTGGAATPLLAAGVAGASAASTGYNTSLSLSKNETLMKAGRDNLDTKAQNAKDLNKNLVDEQKEVMKARETLTVEYNHNLTESDNKLNETQTANTTSTSNANATRSRDTTVSNAAATKNTTISNATTTKDTTIKTATATKDTTIKTATATKDTTISTATTSKNTTLKNAQRSRDASTFGNQTALDIAQDTWNAKISDMNRSKASEIAQATGDCTPDVFGVRGIQVRVMTQPDDITRRQGDMMCRYGYTWHANIERPSLNVMKNFTFWRGIPYLIPLQAPAQAVNDIQELFREGVTVWRDPDKIGASIYDNLEA